MVSRHVQIDSKVRRRSRSERPRMPPGHEKATWHRHQEAYGDLRSADPPFRAAAFGMKFRVGELKGHAEAEGYEGVVGRRLLQTLATNAGYHLAPELMRQRDHAWGFTNREHIAADEDLKSLRDEACFQALVAPPEGVESPSH